MRAGAKGYLLKGATKDEIVRAVTAVSAGEAIFGQAVARHVLSKLAHQIPRSSHSRNSPGVSASLSTVSPEGCRTWR